MEEGVEALIVKKEEQMIVAEAASDTDTTATASAAGTDSDDIGAE